MGLRLKDKSGNELDYTGVTQMEAKIINADGSEDAEVFTRVLSLSAYAIKQTGSENNTAKYTILKKLAYLPAGDFMAFGMSDTEYQELGGDGFTILLTLKTLTVGNEYLATDLY